MPDEWQARQTIPAIFQVCSSMHNEKKITTRARGPFHQSITAILRACRFFFVCFSSSSFLKINAGPRKKQINHQKINTALHRGNVKCDGQEAFARGTINDTIDEKQLISNRPPSCSAAKKQTNKGRPLEQISPAAFLRLHSLSLSPDSGTQRAFTDIANERAQESD